MLLLNNKKRLLSGLLILIMLIPHTTLAEEIGYNLTNIDIPLTPVPGNSEDKYTEDLWDVSDEGIFNDKGEIITSIIQEEVPKPSAEEDATPKTPENTDSFDDYKVSLSNQEGFAKNRLSGIRENLNEQKQRFAELQRKIESTQEKLEPIHETVIQLQEQIDLINKQIRFTKEKMTNAELLIAEKQIEIKDSMLFLQRSEVELGIQKKVVLDYVKLLYQEESRFFDLYDEGSSSLKLLLTNNSVSENLAGKDYVEIMEHTGRQVFYDLDQTRQNILEKQDDLLKQQEDLKFLYDSLSKEKRTYEESRQTKKELLEKTQGDEESYNMLLEEAFQQQLESSISIQNLQMNINLIEGKLDLLNDDTHPASEAEISEVIPVTEQQPKINPEQPDVTEQKTVNKNGKPFSWPVPHNKITAEFHDATYPKKWGLHNAIDIRAKQYTEIKAPANGYVFQTKDNGMGYSYIILAHKNNLVTVYGHVSQIMVTPGTIVKKGEIIGLSGGTPGTKGAGLQTTGAHLHFEVHYKGKPVNPLDYLILEEVPIEYIPDEYLSKMKSTFSQN